MDAIKAWYEERAKHEAERVDSHGPTDGSYL